MMPLLACEASREKMPDRERVRSERTAENPGILNKEDEFRLDSWIQIRDENSEIVKCSWLEDL